MESPRCGLVNHIGGFSRFRLFNQLYLSEIVVYRSVVLVREHPCLPLWGRWHGKAVTEEVLPQYEFAESYRKNETLYRTSPAPCGGTLPKGEGFGCTANDYLTFFNTQKRRQLALAAFVIMRRGNRTEP